MPVLYLLRHGEAETPYSSQPDRMRKLSPKGIVDIQSQAKKHFISYKGSIKIFHSPLVRTCQTASLVNEILDVEMVVQPRLVPSGNVDAVIELLLGVSHDLLFVTHLPLVADLASALTGKRFPFFPGTCAKIVRDDLFSERGELEWLSHP